MVTLKNLENLTESEIGYIAGIIDGEGSIAIAYTFHPGRSKKRCHYLRLYVGITDKPVIDWLVSKLGGSSGKDIRNHPRRTIYKYYLTGKNAANIIKLIRPLLIVKREQADLAIYFQDHKEIVRKGINGNAITDQEYDWRELMKEKISVRNGHSGREKIFKDLQRLNDETSHLR